MVRLLNDGYVFLNNFDGEPEYEADDSGEWEELRLEGEVGYYQNVKNFLEHSICPVKCYMLRIVCVYQTVCNIQDRL